MFKIKSFLKNLNKKFHLKVIDNDNFIEKFGLVYTRWALFIFIIIFILILFTMAYFTINFTGLNKTLKIDKDDNSYNSTTLKRVYKIEDELKKIENWNKRLIDILNDKNDYSISDVKNELSKDSTLTFDQILKKRPIEDSLLRNKVKNSEKDPFQSEKSLKLREFLYYKLPINTQNDYKLTETKMATSLKVENNSEILCPANSYVIYLNKNFIILQHSEGFITKISNIIVSNSIKIGDEIQSGNYLGTSLKNNVLFSLIYEGEHVSYVYYK